MSLVGFDLGSFEFSQLIYRLILFFYIHEYFFPFQDDEAIDDWLPSTLLMHVARIRDVELLTGLSLLTKWSHVESLTNVHTESVRVKLQIQEFSGRWLSDFVSRDTSYQLQKSEKTVEDCRNQLG